MIYIPRPWKLSIFQDPPLPLSIYFQNSSTPLTLDVQFQTNEIKTETKPSHVTFKSTTGSIVLFRPQTVQ